MQRGEGKVSISKTRRIGEQLIGRKDRKRLQNCRERTLIFVAPLTDFSKELDMVARSARSEAELETGFSDSQGPTTDCRGKLELEVVGLGSSVSVWEEIRIPWTWRDG